MDKSQHKSSPSNLDLSHDKEHIRSLVMRVKENNTEAFIELLGCFSRAISSLARSFDIPSSEYEDLCQEGRMALYRAAISYDGVSAEFSTYAGVCMTNAMITFAGKYKASVIGKAYSLSEESSAEGSLKSSCNTEDAVFSKEFSVMLSRAGFAGLSDYERMVVELKLSGLMTRDIAKKTGKSAKSIDNTLFRARKKLRQHIDG